MSSKEFDRIALVFLCVIMLLFCLGGMYRALTVLFMHVPLDPNEGWNAYHAADAIAGRKLYPGSSPEFINNYPPLSFYVVGALGTAMGDNIFAGRVVSVLSFVFSACAVAVTTRRMGAAPIAAVFGALFFASVLLLESDYVGMNDPQLLGQALELSALLMVLLPQGRLSNASWRFVLAALLCVLALFVKHSLFVLPAAIGAWILVTSPGSARTFVAAGFGCALVGLLAFHFIYGDWLIGHLASPRIWSWANFRAGLAGASVSMAAPLAMLLWLFWSEKRDAHVRFCAIYAFLAVVTGVVLLAGDGVDANVLFDAIIAFSLSSALAVDRLLLRPLPIGFAGALVVVAPLAIVLAFSIDSDWVSSDFWVHPWSDETQTAEADIAFLKARPGDVICEELSLCYWARKRETVDVFNLTEAFAAGARNPASLINEIERKRFVVIQTDADATGFTPAIRKAIRQHYVLARSSGDGDFYLSR